MDWVKQTEEIMQSWVQNQKKTWEEFSKTLKSGGVSASAESWRRNVETWEQSVENLLNGQEQMARVWAERLRESAGATEEIRKVAADMEQTTRQWADVQRQAWGEWFRSLKSLDPQAQGSAWEQQAERMTRQWQATAEQALEAQKEWLSRLTGEPGGRGGGKGGS